MTSPPPSETGATAEEIARAVVRQLMDGRNPPLMARMIYPSGRDVAQARIAEAITAARRSAHLEDARAGCEYCAGKWQHFNPEPVRNGDRWGHLCIVTPSDAYYAHCARPEVWDALSLPPGGATK